MANRAEQALHTLQTCTCVFLESYRYTGQMGTPTIAQLKSFQQCLNGFYNKYPEYHYWTIGKPVTVSKSDPPLGQSVEQENGHI